MSVVMADTQRRDDLRRAEVRRNVAANLRRIIKARGLSIRKVAELSGVGHMTVHRLQAGKGDVAHTDLLLIARALDLSTDRLDRPPAE